MYVWFAYECSIQAYCACTVTLQGTSQQLSFEPQHADSSAVASGGQCSAGMALLGNIAPSTISQAAALGFSNTLTTGANDGLSVPGAPYPATMPQLEPWMPEAPAVAAATPLPLNSSSWPMAVAGPPWNMPAAATAAATFTSHNFPGQGSMLDSQAQMPGVYACQLQLQLPGDTASQQLMQLLFPPAAAATNETTPTQLIPSPAQPNQAAQQQQQQQQQQPGPSVAAEHTPEMQEIIQGLPYKGPSNEWYKALASVLQHPAQHDVKVVTEVTDEVLQAALLTDGSASEWQVNMNK